MNKLRSASGQSEQQASIDLTPWLESHTDIRAVDALQLKLHLKLDSTGLLVNGEGSVLLEYMCAKCLTSFSRPFQFSFKERFTRKAEEANEEEGIHFTPSEEVELSPFIEEHFQLSLPFVSLCKEDCLGLCPTCGINRNEQTCSCNNERIDPRLAGLMDLYNEMNK